MKFFINHLSHNRLSNNQPIHYTPYDRPKPRTEMEIYWS